MSWHSTYSPIHPGCEDRPDPKVDRLNRAPATDAGDISITALVKSLMGGPAVAAGGIYLIVVAITTTGQSGTPTWAEINLGVAGSMFAGILVGLTCVVGGALWFRYGLKLHGRLRAQNTAHAAISNQVNHR
jgi:hypothetical protein